jgi:hypothetical protein
LAFLLWGKGNFAYLCGKTLKTSIMVIERTANEFVIRFPFTANTERMQDMIDYLRYKELTANYSAAQSEADNMAREINRKWWKQNAAKFEK